MKQVSLTYLTPSAVEVLIYYHTQGFTPHPRIDAGAVCEAFNRFLELGILERCPRDSFPDSVTTTDLGRAWIEAICTTACPAPPAPEIKTVRNWHPVVGNLLTRLQKAGFELLTVDDGGDEDELHHLKGTPRDRRQAAKAAICSVDDSGLQVLTPNKKKVWISIVLDEQPFDIVAYWNGEELEQTLGEFSDFWAGRQCPEKHLKK